MCRTCPFLRWLFIQQRAHPFPESSFAHTAALKDVERTELAEPLLCGCRGAASGSVTSCPGRRCSGDATCSEIDTRR